MNPPGLFLLGSKIRARESVEELDVVVQGNQPFIVKVETRTFCLDAQKVVTDRVTTVVHRLGAIVLYLYEEPGHC